MENGVAFLVRPKRKPVEGVAAGTSVNPFHSRDPILSLYIYENDVLSLTFYLIGFFFFLKFALVSFFLKTNKKVLTDGRHRFGIHPIMTFNPAQKVFIS
jgi:hypothetical protein